MSKTKWKTLILLTFRRIPCKIHFVFLCMFFFLINSCLYSWSQENPIILKSPDDLLKITFHTVEDRPFETRPNPNRSNPDNIPVAEKLVYEVSYQNKPMIELSALGLELEGSRVLGSDVSINKYTFSTGEDTYKLITGRTNAVSEKYNSVILDIEEKRGEKRKMQIEARAYNEAVAFRYIVPEQSSFTDYRLKSEKTEYRFVKDAICYAQILPNFRSSYESEFYKMPVSGLSNQGGVSSYFIIGMPLLLDIWGIGWAAVTEADLEGNAATYLRNPAGSWTGHRFETVISQNMQEQEIAISGNLPHKTAWRIVMVASDPAYFIESNVMTNLNPECRIDDTSWIKPGKSAWDWWNGSLNRDGERAYTTETMKYYIDFAAESGFEYMTVDAGWSGSDITVCRDNVNIPEVVAYARTKGIKVFIWVGGTNVWLQMNEAFPLYEKWGVAGLKIDFVLRDDQPGIDFYYKVAEKAAKHKLMVDFHGCTKTWGIQRTYPNVVGFEGIIGMEQSKAGVRDNPENRLIIPYTRMIGGLTDYTPGGFNNVKREEFNAIMGGRPMVMGTRAHHLALYVVYESPFQMVSDWPEAYRKDPSFKFIKDVPASWDKTKVLNGYPGEFIIVARKKGNDWYLGSMTNRIPRSFEIILDFLDSGNYIAEIYADAKDSDQFPKSIDIKSIKVKKGDKFRIRMVTDGGLAVQFKKVK